MLPVLYVFVSCHDVHVYHYGYKYLTIICNLRYSILQDLQGIRTVDGGWGLKGAMGIWAG